MSFQARLGQSLLGVLLLFVAFQAAEVWLLIFLSTLLAAFLHLMARQMPVDHGVATTVVVVGLALLTAGFLSWMGWRIATQAGELSHTLPDLVRRLEAQVRRVPGGDELSRSLQEGSVIGRATSAVRATVASLADLVVVLGLSLFFAFQPGVYRAGLLSLVPPAGRERAGQILDEIGEKMGFWMVGRLAGMLFTGVLIGVGLWLLEVPYAAALGTLLGALSFIPNLGPVLAGLPAGLLAFGEGLAKLGQVGLLFLVVQLLDGYVLTPLINQRSVTVPPALGLAAQMLFGVLFGTLGLIVATPLTAVILILVNRLYIQDVLARESSSGLELVCEAAGPC